MRLCADHAAWLRELTATFDLVWASAWGEAANRLICPLFGLPPFPVVALPSAPFAPSEKLAAITRFVGDRPTAWVDDVVTGEMKTWVAARSAPTLIVEVSPALGLTRDAVDRLLAWRIVPQ